MVKRSVRFTADEEEKANEMFTFYGAQGETYSDKFRDFIVKAHRAMRLYEVSQTPDNPAMHPAENITVLRCALRQEIKVPHYDSKTGAKLWIEKKLICVDNPPKYHVLAGIEVCEVCIKKFYGLARKLKTISTPTREPVKVGEQPTIEDLDAQQAQQLPSGFVYGSLADFKKVSHIIKSDGSHYCPFSFLLKSPADCKNCKKEKPQRHKDCVTLYQTIKGLTH